MDLIEWRLDEAEAVGGRAMDGEEVGVVGLVSRIGRQAVLLGGQWVDDPGFKALGCECAFNWQVVDARPLDGDDHVAQAVTSDRLADLGDHGVEAMPVVFDHGGWDEDAAVEVGEHPLGASLGTIDGHDAEVLGSDLLDPRMERPGRLGDGEIAPRSTCPRLEFGSHANTSWERDGESPIYRKVVRMAQREEEFLSTKPHSSGSPEGTEPLASPEAHGRQEGGVPACMERSAWRIPINSSRSWHCPAFFGFRLGRETRIVFRVG